MKNEVNETIETMIEYMQKILMQVPKIIDSYRNDDIEKGSAWMIELSEGLLWIEQAFYLTSEAHGLEMKDFKFPYQELVDSFKNTDYILLADLLEYELIPSIYRLQESLNRYLSRKSN